MRGRQTKGGIEVPKLLSLLAFHDPNATVRGLDAVPPADRPPVNVVRLAFQTMVAIGTALAALGVFYLGVWWRKRRLPRSRWFYRAVVAAGPLSVLALIAGWVTTEVGRQPWITYGVMRTRDAVTPMPGLVVPMVLFTLLYLGLGAIVVALIASLVRETARAAA